MKICAVVDVAWLNTARRFFMCVCFSRVIYVFYVAFCLLLRWIDTTRARMRREQDKEIHTIDLDTVRYVVRAAKVIAIRKVIQFLLLAKEKARMMVLTKKYIFQSIKIQRWWRHVRLITVARNAFIARLWDYTLLKHYEEFKQFRDFCRNTLKLSASSTQRQSLFVANNSRTGSIIVPQSGRSSIIGNQALHMQTGTGRGSNPRGSMSARRSIIATAPTFNRQASIR